MNEKTLEVYTDCSPARKIYGFGILMIDDNDCELKFQFASNASLMDIEFQEDMKKTTTSIGEAYAVLKALENISRKYDKIVLYTDNNHVYETLNNHCKRKVKHIVFNKIIDKCRELMKSLNIEVRHIKAHCGVYGNEMVDKLAKDARKNGIPFCNDYSVKTYQ